MIWNLLEEKSSGDGRMVVALINDSSDKTVHRLMIARVQGLHNQ